jgi:hypothetical protein
MMNCHCPSFKRKVTFASLTILASLVHSPQAYAVEGDNPKTEKVADAENLDLQQANLI